MGTAIDPELKKYYKLLNMSAVSKHLSGNPVLIKPRYVSDKYAHKLFRLIQIIETWDKWQEGFDYEY